MRKPKEILEFEQMCVILEKCPFCGSDGILMSTEMTKKTSRNTPERWPKGAKLLEQEKHKKWHRVAGECFATEVTTYIYSYRTYTACCSNSHCLARRPTPDLPDIREAVARWNRRAGR